MGDSVAGNDQIPDNYYQNTFKIGTVGSRTEPLLIAIFNGIRIPYENPFSVDFSLFSD